MQPKEHGNALIDDITVGERQRKDYSKVPELAKNIDRRGLYNPITVTKDFVLVAGHCRLLACKSLGWTHIPYRFFEDLSLLEQKIIEWCENEHRSDLAWQEKSKAVGEIHDALKEEHGSSWTQENTAQELNVTQGYIAQLLKISKELDHPLVKQASTIITAFNTVKRIHERRDQDTFAGLLTVNGYIPKSDSPIQTADFNTWAPTYSGPKFNVIHCDFPYGINSQDHHGQGRAERSAYDDSPETFWTLFKTLSVHLDNFCSPASHMIFWFSPNIYGNVWEALKLLDGFRWEEHPLIWMRGENEGIAPDPQRRPRRCYEMAFFGWRGDRKLVKTKANIFQAPTEREVHPHEKNEAMLRHFLEMVVDDRTAFFDPAAGSASALRAAQVLGATTLLGLEADESYAAAARRAFANSSSGSGIGRGNGLSDHVAGGPSATDKTANP